METVANLTPLTVMDREHMIQQYAPLVKHVAGRIAMFLPSHIQMEDLLSDGILGLLDAINKFDHGRGVQFKTYAVMRIRGAIVDGLRHLDWVPRRVRRQARTFEERSNELSQRLGRAPTRAELAESMGLPVADLDDLVNDMGGSTVVSLNDVRRVTSNSEIMLGECIPDESQNVALEVEDNDRTQILKATIDELGERERLVLSLYYYDGLSIKEIARVLSVSEPRVSQLHTRALGKLRASLNERHPAYAVISTVSIHTVTGLGQQALWVVLSICGPFLLVTGVIGLTVSVLQSVTQISEASLNFIPKLVVSGLMLLFLGSWMLSVLVSFAASSLSLRVGM